MNESSEHDEMHGAQFSEKVKRYKISCERIAPSKGKKEGVDGNGTIEISGNSITVRVMDVRDNLLYVLVCLATVITVLVVLPWGWKVARVFVLSFPLWIFVIGYLIRKRKVFVISPSDSKVYCMMYSNPTWNRKRLIICLQLPSGKWLGFYLPNQWDRKPVMDKLRQVYGDNMHCEANVEY